MNRASVEICKLCKIKPRVIQDYELNDIELYPNFLEPENFFKLMKIKIPEGIYKDWSLLQYLNRRPDRCCFYFSDYLKSLLLDLKSQGRLTPAEVELLKHRLRRSKWKYEGDN